MSKQVVHYAPSARDLIVVGLRADVLPVDHPDTLCVPRGYRAITSTVQSYDSETGVFETKNSIYKPVIFNDN